MWWRRRWPTPLVLAVMVACALAVAWGVAAGARLLMNSGPVRTIYLPSPASHVPPPSPRGSGTRASPVAPGGPSGSVVPVGAVAPVQHRPPGGFQAPADGP